MRTSQIFVCLFKAPVLCLLWLTKQTVDSVQLSAPERVTAAVSGSMTVSCKYDLSFKENSKYWCKGPVYELCKIVVRTSWNRQNDRISISDDKEAGIFTVTMTSLTENDEDMYWCVISRHGRNVFSGVRLVVSLAVTTLATTTEINSLLILEQNAVSWWETLRWILFILMLCCLASTHIVACRIKSCKEHVVATTISQSKLS